jgi:hypothetical protein
MNEIDALSLAAFGALLALVTGCASPDPANPAGEQMSLALTDGNTENNRHAEACASASSMETVMTELTRHDDAMSAVMTRMDDAQNQMRGGMMRQGTMMSSNCSGASFDDMSNNLSGMRSEMAADSDRMRAAATLEDAQSECSAHADAMRQMMHGMMGDLDSMSCMGM